MAPIDDELRSALSGRADRVSPAADPFEGIERRARGIRRRRGAAAILGTTAAVAVIALAVPAVIGGSSALPDRTGPASPGPTATTSAPAPTRTVPINALRWPSSPLGTEDLDQAVRTAWATQSGEPAADVQGDQLWIGATPDGQRSLGWYQLWTPKTPAATLVLASALPGGSAVLGSRQTTAVPELPGVVDVAEGRERPWVVALGAPGTTDLAYAEDGTTFVDVELETRSAVFPRTGPTTAKVDTVRFRGSAGQLFTDVGTRGGAEGQDPGASDGEPSNLVTWQLRGDLANGPDLVAAKKAFALGLGGKVEDLVFRPLLAIDTDGGLRYVAGQAWLKGGKAHAVAYADGTECGDDVFIGRETPAAAKVLAFSPGCVPGRTTDTVFVVPAPETGQVSYGAEASEYRPVSFLPGLEPVSELERAPLESRGNDRIQVLDGNGDSDKPLYEGSLQELLCGIKSCG